jgi:hypothetical protein
VSVRDSEDAEQLISFTASFSLCLSRTGHSEGKARHPSRSSLFCHGKSFPAPTTPSQLPHAAGQGRRHSLTSICTLESLLRDDLAEEDMANGETCPSKIANVKDQGQRGVASWHRTRDRNDTALHHTISSQARRHSHARSSTMRGERERREWGERADRTASSPRVANCGISDVARPFGADALSMSERNRLSTKRMMPALLVPRRQARPWSTTSPRHHRRLAGHITSSDPRSRAPVCGDQVRRDLTTLDEVSDHSYPSLLDRAPSQRRILRAALPSFSPWPTYVSLP